MPANSKTYSYIRTTMEIQLDSTGETQSWASGKIGYVKNAKVEANITTEKGYSVKLAAFSAHEVVGKQGFVQYCNTTF
jgi:hypothetical protein